MYSHDAAIDLPLRALVVGDAPSGTGDLLRLAGFSVADAVPIDGAEARLDEQIAADLVLLGTAGIAEARVAPLLAAVQAAAAGLGAALIVDLARDQLDAGAALVGAARVQLLCDASDSERLAALMLARQLGRGDRLGDAAREAERLRQLNAEVARIAEVLAKLSRASADGGGAALPLADDARGYGGPPPDSGAPVPVATVRAVIRARRLRERFFDASLFGDPAWDMLLDLFAAELDHARVSVSSLCIAAAVPATTALRWIGSMSEAGLFERRADPFDRRRAFIALSANASIAMRRYFAALAEAELPGG